MRFILITLLCLLFLGFTFCFKELFKQVLVTASFAGCSSKLWEEVASKLELAEVE